MLVAWLGVIVGLAAAIGGYLAWAHSPPSLAHSRPRSGSDPKLAELQGLMAELGAPPAASRRRFDLTTDFRDAAELDRYIPPRESQLARLSRLMRAHTPFPTASPYPTPTELDPYYRSRAWQFAEIKRCYYRKQWSAGLLHCLHQIEIGGKLAPKGYWAPHKYGLDQVVIGAILAERFVPHLSAPEARAAGATLEKILDEFPSEAEIGPVVRAGRMSDVAHWLTYDEPYAEWLRTWRAPIPPSTERFLVATLKTFYPRPWVYAQVDDRSEARKRELQKPASQRPNPVPATDPLAGGFLFGWQWAELEYFPACRTQLQLLRLELALQEHRRATGAYPKTLAELDGRLPKAFLIDPMSGKPMAYRFPRPVTSAVVRFPYLLYSYGLDREDGGGRSPARRVEDPSPGRDLVAGVVVLR